MRGCGTSTDSIRSRCSAWRRARPASEIREAYFALAKVYHPDRYATAELPTEVIEYLFAMARRINAAHAALNVEQKKQARQAGAGVHLGGAVTPPSSRSAKHRGHWATRRARAAAGWRQGLAVVLSFA